MDGKEFSCELEFQEISYSSILTVNLADGWMDGTDDGHTDGQTEFQVE